MWGQDRFRLEPLPQGNRRQMEQLGEGWMTHSDSGMHKLKLQLPPLPRRMRMHSPSKRLPPLPPPPLPPLPPPPLPPPPLVEARSRITPFRRHQVMWLTRLLSQRVRSPL